jgi:hypothetical protein
MSDTRIVEIRDFLFAPTTRVWIYGVSIAVIAVLQGYGIIVDEKVSLWTGLVSAVIGAANLGILAIPNVPTNAPYSAFDTENKA